MLVNLMEKLIALYVLLFNFHHSILNKNASPIVHLIHMIRSVLNVIGDASIVQMKVSFLVLHAIIGL